MLVQTCQREGCGAQIFWIKSEKGRATPVDTRKKSIFTEVEGTWKLVQGYESHFATCLNPPTKKKAANADAP